MSPIPSEDRGSVRREVVNDLFAGGLSLLLSAALAAIHYGQAGRLHDDFGRDPGPALLPVALLIVLGLAGFGLSLRGWFGLKREGPVRGGVSVKSSWPAVIALCLMAILIPLRDLLGAAPSLALIGCALALLAGRSSDAGWLPKALAGAAVGLGFYALFHFGLSVPL